jgi:hypothetical protein
MKALSIQQPWASLIIRGHKDVENRSWPTNYRGPLLIHAGKTFDREGLLFIRNTFGYICDGLEDGSIFPLGCIIGRVNLIGCCTRHPSKWFFGPYGFVLQSPVIMKPPIPYRGKLSLFDIPDEILKGEKSGND